MSALDQLLDMYNPDPKVEEIARRRQAAVFRSEETDYLPLLLKVRPPREAMPLATFDFMKCYYDRELMLSCFLRHMMGISNAKSDALPSVRPNLGTAHMATILGAKQTVRPDINAAITGHPSKEEIARMEAPEIRSAGEMPRVLDYIAFFKEKLNGKGSLWAADTQGPFDIAHLVRGEAIFTDFYDDPQFVHHLMELCTQIYIEANKAIKEAMGEPLDHMHYMNALYAENTGVRICEDTTTLLSPDLIDEFVMPYTKRALEPFGAAYYHYCGRGEHFYREVVKLDVVTGVNLGNPDFHCYTEFIGALVENNACYVGTPGGTFREKDEPLDAFFRRMIEPLNGKRSHIILSCNCLTNGNGEEDPAGTMQLWHDIQDEVLGAA